MKKILIFIVISVSVMLLVSCQKEQMPDQLLETGKVPSLQEPSVPVTSSMRSEEDIEKIYPYIVAAM